MQTLKVGHVTITSIIERDGPWRKPEDMFPAYDPAIGRRHLASLASSSALLQQAWRAVQPTVGSSNDRETGAQPPQGSGQIRARGIRLGRQVGQRPSDKKAKRVLGMHADGLSYRLIARNVGLSKNTVMDIVRRNSGEC